MSEYRRAVSTLFQDKEDEKLLSAVCDQLTHSKLIARLYYKNIRAVRSSAKNIEAIHKHLENAGDDVNAVEMQD